MGRAIGQRLSWKLQDGERTGKVAMSHISSWKTMSTTTGSCINL